MVDRFKGTPFSFGALRSTFGPLYIRCDLCRRFALLQLGPHNLRDVDSRTKRFSCSVCGAEAWLTVTNPTSELGMEAIGSTSAKIRNATRPPLLDCSADAKA